jgi:hypothetical protein
MIRTVLSSLAAAAMLSILASGPAHSQKSKPSSAHVPISLGDGSRPYGTVRGRMAPGRYAPFGR